MTGTQVKGTAVRSPEPGADMCDHFLAFLGGGDYPCVGAKVALARGTIETQAFGSLGDAGNDAPLLARLTQFVAMLDATNWEEGSAHSFVAIFSGPLDINERRFESLMWAQLWRLHELDVAAGNLPADDVSSDADSPLFSLSVAGHPFCLIGLHANASRLARRFTHPVLVFNSHRQFEKLREDGPYAKMQTATRARDVDLQGSINPNLADFGQAIEARQYSGREVEDGWKCPYDFQEKS